MSSLTDVQPVLATVQKRKLGHRKRPRATQSQWRELAWRGSPHTRRSLAHSRRTKVRLKILPSFLFPSSLWGPGVKHPSETKEKVVNSVFILGWAPTQIKSSQNIVMALWWLASVHVILNDINRHEMAVVVYGMFRLNFKRKMKKCCPSLSGSQS